jgi:hypothetical protein
MEPKPNAAPIVAMAKDAQQQLGVYALELRLIARGEVWPRTPIRLNGGKGQAPTPALLDLAHTLSTQLQMDGLKHGFRSAVFSITWQPEA